MSTSTILCVDDERNVLLTLRAQLIRHFPDYTIEIAESGAEALELVEELISAGIEIPLVIADQIMLGMPGDELLIELQARHPEILKVMLTGQARAEDVGNVVNRGNLYRFIAKPWNETDLILTVTEALRRYQQEQQLAQQQAALEQANREQEAFNANLESQMQERTQQLSDLKFAIDQAAIVATTDAQGRITDVNDLFCKLSQYSRDELIGNTHQLINSGFHPQSFFQDLWRTISSGQVWKGEIKNRAKDGSEYWVDTVIVPFLDGRGRPFQYMAIRFDITQRKQAEIALQESQQFIQQVADSSPNVIYIYDLAEQQNIYVNREVYTFLAYTSEEIQQQVKQSLANLMHSNDVELAMRHFERLTTLPDGAFAEFEYRMQHKNGEWRWFLSRDTVFKRDADGNVTQILGNAQDITDRKQAELALVEIERQQRSILEHIPSFIAKVDREGRMLFLNRTAPGFTPNEVIGQTLDTFTAPESRAIQQAALAEVFATGRTAVIETQGTGAHKNAAIYEVRIAPIPTDGQIDTAIVVATDITDRKHAELELRQREEQIQAIAANLPGFLYRLVVHPDGSMSLPYISSGAEQIFGLPIASLQAEAASSFDFIHPDDRPLVAAAITDGVQTLTSSSVECRLIDATGHLKWLNILCQAHRSKTGDTIFDGVTLNISQRKQLELERQRAEAALRKSEAQYRRIVETANEGIWIIDTDSKTSFVNPRMAEMLGHSVDEMLGKSMFEFMDEAGIAIATQTAERRQGITEQHDFKFQHKSGADVWALLATSPIFDDDGQYIGALAMITDITDRKQTEAALQESERLLSMALSAAKAGVWEWNMHTNATYWSDENFRLMGYEPGSIETTFENWLQAVHPDEREQANAYVAQVVAEQSDLNLEYRVLLPDGSIRWLIDIGRIIFDAQHNPISMTGIQVDITDRKQAEVAFRESEEKFRQMAETISDIFWMMDVEQEQVLYISPAYERVWGRSREQLYQDWGAGFAYIHPEDQERIALISAQALQTDGFEVEYRIVRPDGTIRYLLDRGFVVPNEQGRLTRLVGVAQDITDRKQAELALQHLNEELEQRVQQRTQALRQSEQRYATLAAMVPVGLYQTNLEGACLYVNERCCSIMGRTSADSLGYGWTQSLHPDDREMVVQTWNHCAQTGAAFYLEYRFQRPDGTVSWVIGQAVQEVDETGTVQGYVGTVTDISDRKQAEAALQAERLRLQLALDAAQMGTWSCSLSTGQLFWSDRAQEIFGFVPGTFPGDRDTFLAMVHPEDQEHVVQAIAHTFATGAPYQIEYRIRRLDDEIRWIAVWGIIPQNLPSAEAQLIGVVADISDRKQAEEKLRQKEEQYRTIFEAVSDGIFINDLETGAVLEVNPAACRMHGYTYEEMINLPQPEFIHPDSLPVFANYIQTLKAGIKFAAEAIDIRKNGEVFDVEVIGTQFFFNNKLCGLGLVRDISDRKQAEAQVRDQEQFLRSIYEGVNQPIFVADVLPDQSIQVIGWNPIAAAMAGKSSEEVAGKTIGEIFATNEALEILHRYAQCIAAKQPLTFEECIPFYGQTRWLLSTYNPLINAEGRVYRVVGTVYDITDRKQAEAALQQLNLELEQRVSDRTLALQQAMEAAESANRAKSIFLANMSHELRTPLNAILGFAQLMSRDMTLEPGKRNQLAIINRSGKHLLNLINDILEMSKIEAGRIQFAPTSFDLYALLGTLEELFRHRAVEKGLYFVIDRSPTLPQHVETDENKLRQVLINLIGNAIKFTTSGRVELRVFEKLGVLGENDVALQFAVVDSGIGIAAEELDILFEPFIQSKNRQVFQEGTGLGLSISRQFVRLMGGDLSVTSTLGVGSTFSFTIPVRLVDAAQLPAPVSPGHILGLAPNQPCYRILVIEDTETNRLLMVQLLQSIGFEVQSAANGEAAIALWQRWQPHLIWMDMRLPGMDGYEATHQIRLQESLASERHEVEEASLARATRYAPRTTSPPTIIIALTASAFEEDRARVLAVGCNDFVRKPFQEVELLEKMAEHLGVKYVYAEAAAEMAPNPSTSSLDAIAALRSLPASLLTQLHQATLELDNEHLADLLQQVATEQPALAALLLHKLDNFDLEDILHLLQEAMNG